MEKTYMENIINDVAFDTHNDNGDIDCSGTGLAGEIKIRFSKLVKAFGLPLPASDDWKCKAGREILFSDGLVGTIYDWKEYDKELDDITEWHIGAHKKWGEVVDKIIKILFG